MTGSHVLVELVIVLGTAALVTVVFQALRLPVVLGYVLAGLLIGPHVPVPLVANAELVHVLSELGVILLMFTIGLELPLSAIRRVGPTGAVTALFEVAFAIAIGTLVARLLGLDPVTALFAGACLGISSTMIVAKTFEELGFKGGFTDVVFAILVFEDLIAIVLLAILAGVAGGAGLAAPDVAVLLAKLAGFLAALVVGGLLVVPRAIRWIERNARPETLVIAALATCFGASALAAEAGFSVALGAFVAGVLIAESGHGHAVFELVRPLRDVFAMVFFVSVGMTIVPASLLEQAPRIAVLALVVLIAKPLGVSIGVFLAGHGVRPAVRAGLSLAQIGELSFVIAALVPDPTLLPIAVGVAIVTTLTSSPSIRHGEAISAWIAARLPKGIATFVSFYESWLSKLRERRAGGRSRRSRWIIALVVDAIAVIAIAITGSTLGPDMTAALGLEGAVATAVQIAAAVLLVLPFALAAFRTIALIARQLATEVIPSDGREDLARAPRRVLVATLELAFGLAICVPVVAAIQPFVPASPLIVAFALILLLAVVRRSIVDFEGHVRAGSELVLELITRPAAASPVTLEQVGTILPGFHGITRLALAVTSPAVGRSLADLDLRARTGATVLAIARGDGGVATPSPTEPLRAGDVLALAGSDEAIAAARAMLDPASV